jgi:hypothetical protein
MSVTFSIESIRNTLARGGVRYRVIWAPDDVLPGAGYVIPGMKVLEIAGQNRRSVVMEEFYHLKVKYEGFLRSEINAIKKTMPLEKIPAGSTAPIQLDRARAAEEIAIKQYILDNPQDILDRSRIILSPSDISYFKDQIAVLREWGVAFGY